MTKSHPTFSRGPAPRSATCLETHEAGARAAFSRSVRMPWGLGQPPSPGLGLAAPGEGLSPQHRPGWVRGGGRGRLGPLGSWWSDQGDFGLKTGGAARARADAGQHGHLCAARGAVAASQWVLVFGAPA